MNRKSPTIFITVGVGALLIILLVFQLTKDGGSFGHRLNNPATTAKAAAVGTVNLPTGPLKVKYASPPPKIAPVAADPTPIPVQAVVTRKDKPYTPNFYAGQSERLAVQSNEQVPIELSWPGDTTHSDVFVQAVHGGKIDGTGNSRRFSLAESKTVSFTFTPDAGPGSYELVLRRGTVEEALRFWVSTGNPKADPPTIK
jgi:hypothetical protein